MCHNFLLGGTFGLAFDIPSPIVMSERLTSLMNYEEQVINHISRLGICFHSIHQCGHARFHGESQVCSLSLRKHPCHDVRKEEGRSDCTATISNGPEVYCNLCKVKNHPESPKQKETGNFIPSLSQGMGNFCQVNVSYKN